MPGQKGMYRYNLGLGFEDIAEKHSHEPALKLARDNVISYRELNETANRIARVFLERGVGRHDVVCISSIKAAETFAGILACLKIGAIYTVVDRFGPTERLRKILDNCLPKLLYVDERLDEAVVPLGLPAEKLILSSAEFARMAQAQEAANLPETLDVTSSNPAYIMYTSGSTGFPKGAVMTHANVLNLISWSIGEFGFAAGDVLTNVNPLFFDNSVFDLYSSLFSGACLAPFNREMLGNPREIVARIGELKCTSWFSVPSLLIYMTTLGAFSRDNMLPIRRFIFGGEGYPKAKLKVLYDLYADRCVLTNVYGPTECTCICSAHEMTSGDLRDPAGIPMLGDIIRNFSYLILDEEGREAAPGTVGELCLLGPHVGLGYYNDAERTRQSFVPNSFNGMFDEIMYRTGDLVRFDGADKSLYFVSRKDYQVKHMGYRLELGEIEYALNTLEYVAEAAVLYGERSGLKQIVAVVRLNRPVTEPVLKNDLQRVIPEYMVPRKIVVVEEIVKNANGKIDRRRLTEQYFQPKGS